MNIGMNAHLARLARERRLWAESREWEYRLVGQVLEPWIRRLIAEGIPTEEMLEQDSTREMLEAVGRWCRDYAQWRERCGLAFINGHPVESWAGQVPAERRAAVLFRIADHLHGEGEVERAWRLRRWAVQSLLEEYAVEG